MVINGLFIQDVLTEVFPIISTLNSFHYIIILLCGLLASLVIVYIVKESKQKAPDEEYLEQPDKTHAQTKNSAYEVPEAGDSPPGDGNEKWIKEDREMKKRPFDTRQTAMFNQSRPISSVMKMLLCFIVAIAIMAIGFSIYKNPAFLLQDSGAEHIEFTNFIEAALISLAIGLGILIGFFVIIFLVITILRAMWGLITAKNKFFSGNLNPQIYLISIVLFFGASYGLSKFGTLDSVIIALDGDSFARPLYLIIFLIVAIILIHIIYSLLRSIFDQRGSLHIFGDEMLQRLILIGCSILNTAIDYLEFIPDFFSVIHDSTYDDDIDPLDTSELSEIEAQIDMLKRGQRNTDDKEEKKVE